MFDSRSKPVVTRRRFLEVGRKLGAAGIVGSPLLEQATLRAEEGPGVVGIDRDVILEGGEGKVTWFHPRPCVVTATEGTFASMTLEPINGSDVFGPVHWTISKDFGQSWAEPQRIDGLGRRSLGDGGEAGVCDVVPEYHSRTKRVLAIGHNVCYKNGVLARPHRRRWSVYTVQLPDGSWTEPRRLDWDDPRGSSIYTCGCSQRVIKAHGDVLLPLSLGPEGRTDRLVTTVLCTFDGEHLRIRNVGNKLVNRTGRGLLEPSLTFLDGRYFLTIRAEDGRGYVSTSEDGLRWDPPRAWDWDNGAPVVMSSTQHHWMTHSEGLFLVYTRKKEGNEKVIRWRSPLLMAEVDQSTLRLIRSTDRVVLPLTGDGTNDPKHVALMGNFHTVAASPGEFWVTVGENRPYERYRGNTLLARVRWNQPNQLVPEPVRA